MNRDEIKEEIINEKKIDKTVKIKKRDRLYYSAVTILYLFFIIYIILISIAKQTSYASSTAIVEEPKQVILRYDENIIQIPNPKDMIQETVDVTRKEELSVEVMDLEYLTEYQNNPDLPRGTLQVMQNGVVGEQEIITKKIYEDDILVSEEQVGNKVTKSALNKIVVIGTGPYRVVTEANVGDNVYVTSTMLSIYLEPTEQSQKIITLYK